MNDSVLVPGGGLPVSIDANVIGGIGVGGAPGAHLDEACARVGQAVTENPPQETAPESYSTAARA